MTPAEERADALFRRLMTPQQRRCWDRHRYCAQEGKSGRVYLILDDHRTGVIVIREHEAIRSNIYSHIYGVVPWRDQHIALLLHARNDEQSTLLQSCSRPGFAFESHERAAVTHYRALAARRRLSRLRAKRRHAPRKKRRA